ncbi:MAG: DUF1569 domain-containing protein [Chitinophagaceae bacterium]|nr:DUF1569 domain-containing protein [Chitinophagaceae bacterium]
MEVKNLFDTSVKKEIIDRINKLSPQTLRQWGKMDVAQMLAHCQMPMGVALGKHKLKGSFIIKLLGPFFKKTLYNDKPFKRSLPTDKSFVITDAKDFEKEKNSLIDMINSFTEGNMTSEPHPFFGKLTKEEWSKGTYKHLDHHLQQFGV